MKRYTAHVVRRFLQPDRIESSNLLCRKHLGISSPRLDNRQAVFAIFQGINRKHTVLIGISIRIGNSIVYAQRIYAGIGLADSQRRIRSGLAIDNGYKRNLAFVRIRQQVDNFRFIRIKLYRQTSINNLEAAQGIRTHKHVHTAHTDPDKITAIRNIGITTESRHGFKLHGIKVCTIIRGIKACKSRTTMHNSQAVIAIWLLKREVSVSIGIEVRIHKCVRCAVNGRRMINTSNSNSCVRSYSAIAHIGKTVRRFAAGASSNVIRTAP